MSTDPAGTGEVWLERELNFGPGRAFRFRATASGKLEWLRAGSTWERTPITGWTHQEQRALHDLFDSARAQNWSLFALEARIGRAYMERGRALIRRGWASFTVTGTSSRVQYPNTPDEQEWLRRMAEGAPNVP